MKIDPARHLDQPWRVHQLAADFELLDVWEFAIDDQPDLDHLFEVIRGGFLGSDDRVVSALVSLRAALGRWFGWDREVARPILGCVETSISERLTKEDRKLTSTTPGTIGASELEGLRHVYSFEREALLEISNATIHGLLHLSWPHSSRPRLAVYVKHRGVSSRIYMAMISPFRHLFVYPALVEHVARRW
jgi:hypothetical protein